MPTLDGFLQLGRSKKPSEKALAGDQSVVVLYSKHFVPSNIRVPLPNELFNQIATF